LVQQIGPQSVNAGIVAATTPRNCNTDNLLTANGWNAHDEMALLASTAGKG
jgi:hypothetical protein